MTDKIDDPKDAEIARLRSLILRVAQRGLQIADEHKDEAGGAATEAVLAAIQPVVHEAIRSRARTEPTEVDAPIMYATWRGKPIEGLSDEEFAKVMDWFLFEGGICQPPTAPDVLYREWHRRERAKLDVQ